MTYRIHNNFEAIQELKKRMQKLEDRIIFLENFIEMDYKLSENNNPDDGSWKNR